jgi:rRNA maturation RNase YbeY
MAAQKLPVHFHFADLRFLFPKRTEAKEIILELIDKEGKEVQEINYIFCTDTYLLQLNKSFLKHDTLTDIITFHYHAKDAPVHSDIYISVERVKENAGLFGVHFLHELYRVLFHGALHLCGYKDKTKKDKQAMRSKEDFYLEHFNVSRGTKSKA